MADEPTLLGLIWRMMKFAALVVHRIAGVISGAAVGFLVALVTMIAGQWFLFSPERDAWFRIGISCLTVAGAAVVGAVLGFVWPGPFIALANRIPGVSSPPPPPIPPDPVDSQQTNSNSN